MSDYPFLVDASITSELDSATLHAIGRNVWPADCQSCGRPFGAELPALVVTDVAVMSIASLHHEKCSPPRWDDSGAITTTRQSFLSYRTFVCGVPLEAGGQPRTLPFAFVNPSLEQVMLTRAAGTGWGIATVQHFRDCGLTGMALNNPSPDTRLVLRADGIGVVRLERSGESWELDCRYPGVLDLIRGNRGIALALTTAYLPDQHFTTAEGIAYGLQSGDLALGWVPLR
jgi:hypothetical protein